MIRIKKVDMALETAYRLYELGISVIYDNGDILLVREG